MEKREKKKTSKLRRVRPRLNLSIDPENHEYLKNIGVNASRLLDKAVNELRKVSHHGLVLISEKKEEEWTQRDLNPRLLRCERSDYARDGGEIAIGEQIGDNFSNLADIVKEVVIPRKDEYMEYLQGDSVYQRGLSKDRATAYYNRLIDLPDIPEPQALITLGLGEYPILAIKALLDYLQMYTKIRSISGYSFDEWKTFLIQPKREQQGKVKQVSTEQVIAAYKATPDELKTFFKMLMYTGIRGEHAVRLYEQMQKAGRPMKFTREDIITFPKVAGAAAIDPTPAAAKRGKKAEIALLPASFVDELIRYEYPGYAKGTVSSRLSDVGDAIKSSFPGSPKFSMKSLRKYHAQMLLASKVDTLIIDYLQGRQPRESAVLIAHYASPDEEAASQYVEKVLISANTFPDLKAPAAPVKPVKTAPASPATGNVSGLAKIWKQTADRFQQEIPINPETKGPDTRSHQYNNYTAVKTFLTDHDTPSITKPDDLRAAILRTKNPTYKNRLKGLRAWFRSLPEGPLGYPEDEWINALSRIK